MVNEERALQLAIAFEATQRLQIKHRDSRGINVTSLVASLLRIVTNEKRMRVTLCKPLHRIVLIDKTGIHVENLICIGHTMNRPCQSRTAAVGRMQKLQRIGRILNEVIAVRHAHCTQSVKTDGTIGSGILIRCQLTVSLRCGRQT